MDGWYFLISIFFVKATADIGHVLTLNAQKDERIRLECTLISKTDAEEAMWMRIRPPHNPDILTYRDSVVYEPDRIALEQRRLSSSMNANGTFIDTYFLTLTILRPTIEDEGRYICSRSRIVFAEYDLFVIVPPQFVDDNNFTQQRTVTEGSTLHLSCSVYGRPIPSITWFYRTKNAKHVLLGDGKGCRNTTCKLRLENYTRHDPTLIECIADNEKSTRISKIFNIDIFYPPKIITNVRTLTGSTAIDVFLECSSSANPLPSIMWLDDNRQEFHNHHLYTIKTNNLSSNLSFSVFSHEHSKVLFYCRSNNSIGTVEKLVNISEFIQFDWKSNNRTTIVPFTRRVSSSKKQETISPSRVRTKPPITTTISSHSSISSNSNVLFIIFIIFNFRKK